MAGPGSRTSPCEQPAGRRRPTSEPLLGCDEYVSLGRRPRRSSPRGAGCIRRPPNADEFLLKLATCALSAAHRAPRAEPSAQPTPRRSTTAAAASRQWQPRLQPRQFPCRPLPRPRRPPRSSGGSPRQRHRLHLSHRPRLPAARACRRSRRVDGSGRRATPASPLPRRWAHPVLADNARRLRGRPPQAGVASRRRMSPRAGRRRRRQEIIQP